jgi:hypothetical protein
MKRSIRNTRRQDSLVIMFAIIMLMVLMASGMFAKPGFPALKAGKGQPVALTQLQPTVTSQCITGSIDAADPDFNHPLDNCAAGSGSTNYDVYQFLLSSCTGTASINATTCSSSCGTAPAGIKDSWVGIYQNSGSPGTAVPFNPASPTTNLKACDDDTTGAACTAPGAAGAFLSNATATGISNGFFMVVVSGFDTLADSLGTYRLLVNISAQTGTGCSFVHVNNNPTAITLSGFTAKRYDSGALIEWQTGSETDNLGFNVYREQNGKRVKINSQIIAGSALLTGPGTNLAAGGSYSWWDDSPQGKHAAHYYLEEIKLSGESVNHGPLVPADSVDHSLRPARARSTLLSDLTTATSSSKPVERSVTTATATAAATAEQVNAFASRPAVKMSIKQEGWYRVSQQELLAAGLDSKTDPRNLQLFVDGNEQPMLVQGEQDGRLDAVEFYGVGLDIPSTDSRTYWLVAGSTAGQRISQGKAKAKRDASASFAYTVERRDQTLFVPSLKTDSYFGAIIAKNPTDQSLDLPHVDQASSKQAKIDISLQGLTQVPHQVKVLLNDDLLGEMFFDGQAQGKSTFSVPQAWLKQGANKITLIPEAGDTDISVVNTIRITYQHTYSADGDALRFTASQKQSVTIDGFTSPAIRVVDITNPNEAKEVTGKIRQQGSGYAITIGVPKKGERTLLAFSDSQIKRPVSIAANQPSNWREPNNQADLLVIGHHDFLESVKPLVALRQSQGLAVAVADVEDVFDEFSFGNKTPQAIKDFLSYASTSWQKAPRFVLLVGDATNDPRNFLGNGDFDFVPTKMIATGYNQTASDSWFADFADNGLPQIAIGRLPVRTAQEAELMIAKIVGFDQTSKSGGVLLVSDINDGSDFEGTSAELRSLVPAEVRTDELRRSQMDTAALRSSLIDNLNRGEKIVNYVGHGSVEMWRGGILTPDDVRSLTNSQPLPFFISATCLNGYFQDPVSDSFAERLMKAERGGALGVWASSGFVEAEPQAVMNKAAFGLIFGSDSMTVGEALNRARASVSDIDVRRTYTLFGDPSMKLR